MSDSTPFDPVTNVGDAPVETSGSAAPWAGDWKVLTPHMRGAGGKLGMVQGRMPSGNVGCPFHWHAREDEIFYVISGRGILRYGDSLREVGPGDCISCPAGRQTAHQLANPFDEDLVYLAIGNNDPHEVRGYPDNGKVMVRHLQQVGSFEPRDYMHNEPDPPLIFDLIKKANKSD